MASDTGLPMTARTPDPRTGRGRINRRYGPPWTRAEPPDWWPDDEPWPPQRPPWRVNRRFVLTRVFILIGTIFILIAVLGWLANSFWHANGGGTGASGQHKGPPEAVRAIFGIIVILTIVFFIVRRIRRTVEPLVDVMDAADRVAEGDYGVRVPVGATGDVGRLIDSFNAMAVRLDENETQRQRLFSDIAHELRTPLAIVQGNIEGMLDGIYPRDDAHLAPLLDETRVISRLLTDLQTIATAEAGMLHLHREPTDIHDLLQDVLAAFQPTATAHEIGISCTSERTELAVDPVRIRQVLDNLVANAIRYTPPGGRIQLAARREGDAVIVSVTDNGRGMPAAEAAHMFERFVKSADSGGSGLGLAIAKGIVEAHGGTISATSAEGKGTTVRFTLPIA